MKISSRRPSRRGAAGARRRLAARGARLARLRRGLRPLPRAVARAGPAPGSPPGRSRRPSRGARPERRRGDALAERIADDLAEAAPAGAAAGVYPCGSTLVRVGSSPISISTRSSPPSRSSRTPSCAACRSSSAATRTAAGSSRPRTTSRAASAIVSAMSCAEALRRCPHGRLRPPAACALPRVLARGLVDRPRDRADRRAGRDRRGVPRPRRGGAGLRRRPRARRGGAGGRPGPDAALVLARRRDLEGRREGRLRPAQARRPDGRPARAARRAFLAPFPIRVLPGDRPARRGAARRRPASRRSAQLAALADADARPAPARARSGALVRDRARGIDPRPLEVSTERISISNEETFARDVGDVERLHDELRRMADRLAEHLREREQTARTVTTKLRYPDFAIRTRSTSLEVGIDDGDADRRARLLAARPGAARPARARCGSSGSASPGSTDHAQLELTL